MRTFAQILASLPLDIPRVHHGRSPETGFDCVGLPLWVYREAGWPLDDADVQYARDEADAFNSHGMIEQQLSGRLIDATASVRAGMDRDGDIWVFSIGDGLRHAGVYADGIVYHMAHDLQSRDAIRVRPHLRRAFRMPRQINPF